MIRSRRRGRYTPPANEQFERANFTVKTRVRDAMVTEPATHPASTSIAELKELFLNDHMCMALLVDGNKLVTTIEPDDLTAKHHADAPATSTGTTDGRTTRPDVPLTVAAAAMRRAMTRRMAVVDDCGCLIGLLCLKQRGTGFCSDEDVRNRGRIPRNSPLAVRRFERRERPRALRSRGRCSASALADRNRSPAGARRTAPAVTVSVSVRSAREPGAERLSGDRPAIVLRCRHCRHQRGGQASRRDDAGALHGRRRRDSNPRWRIRPP